MKSTLIILLFQCYFINSFCQSLKKYEIGNSGCSAYFFCDPGTFAQSYSDDSSRVYTAECNAEGTAYGLIFVKLATPVSEITAAEDLLVAYMDYLKKAFKITSAVGYGKGHRLKEKESIHGIIDYWMDENKNNWKVKGWTDGRFIAVLYADLLKDVPENKVDVFLDGILLEGM